MPPLAEIRAYITELEEHGIPFPDSYSRLLLAVAEAAQAAYENDPAATWPALDDALAALEQAP